MSESDPAAKAREIASFSYEWWHDETPTSWDGTEELTNYIAAALEAEYKRGVQDGNLTSLDLSYESGRKAGREEAEMKWQKEAVALEKRLLETEREAMRLIAEAHQAERAYWQEFMRLNKFEDQSECRKAARQAALEEAAKVAEDHYNERANGKGYGIEKSDKIVPYDIARQIRQLKGEK